MKKILIIDKSKSQQEIIRNITQQAREVLNYKKDVLYRCLMGIKNHTEIDFNRILHKIISQELPEIQEIIICKTDRFEKYIEV